MSTVTGLNITAVKGTRLRGVESVTLAGAGADGNRRFYLIDERNRMVNGKQLGALQTVVASAQDGRLALTLPDGQLIDGPVTPGLVVDTTFFSGAREARLIDGPWSEALSELTGRPLRLVDAGAGGAVDRGAEGGVTLISRGSLERLAAEAGTSSVDSRRFRMLIEVDAIGAHEEDAWVGRRARVGDALIEWGGHVGRCLVTSRHPETGKVDLSTLDLLRDYRGELATTEPLPFGIYGSVLEPGAVHVGDRVTLA